MRVSEQQIILVVAQSLRDFNHELMSRGMIFNPEAEYSRTQDSITIGNKTWRYVSDPNKMRGFHGVEVEFWGMFWTMDPKKLKEYEQLAQMARMK